MTKWFTSKVVMNFACDSRYRSMKLYNLLPFRQKISIWRQKRTNHQILHVIDRI